MDSNDTFCIVPISYLSTLDFFTVRQTSPATCRTSLDGSKAVISWEGEPPAGIEWPTFTLDEIRVQMQRSEWTEIEYLSDAVVKIYTETPFEPWTSSFGEISPVNPRSEGWVFPANVGWEEELTARAMQWEYIEVTKDSEGAWASVKSYAGGLWDTLKGLFS